MNYIDTITILSRKERKQEIYIFNLIFPEGMRAAQLINFLVDSLHSGQHGSIDMIGCLFTPIYSFAGSRYYNDTTICPNAVFKTW